jgi:hypothetical protein
MFTVTALLPILASRKPRKSTAAATMLHALRDYRRTRRQPNPIETAAKIAFAYGHKSSAKKPVKGSAWIIPEGGLFQNGGTARKESQ